MLDLLFLHALKNAGVNQLLVPISISVSVIAQMSNETLSVSPGSAACPTGVSESKSGSPVKKWKCVLNNGVDEERHRMMTWLH